MTRLDFGKNTKARGAQMAEFNEEIGQRLISRGECHRLRFDFRFDRVLGRKSERRKKRAFSLEYVAVRIDLQRVKLSMKLGDEYRFRNIQLRHWQRMAEELRLDPDKVVQGVDDLATQLADQAPDIELRMTQEGTTHPLIPRLAKRLAKRAAACRKILR
jgi:hypothetical protein